MAAVQEVSGVLMLISRFKACVLFSLPSDTVSNKLQGSNVFTVARRTADAQELLYLSIKLTNGIWVLTELRIPSANPNHTVRGVGVCVCERENVSDTEWDRERETGTERRRVRERARGTQRGTE